VLTERVFRKFVAGIKQRGLSWLPEPVRFECLGSLPSGRTARRSTQSAEPWQRGVCASGVHVFLSEGS
jgi:hypothetical protein